MQVDAERLRRRAREIAKKYPPTPAAAQALLRTAVLEAYDPQQPRRSDGKWGSKGGSIRSSGGGGTPGKTPEGEASRDALLQEQRSILQAEKDRLANIYGEDGVDHWAAQDKVSSNQKAQAMNAIGAELDAAFPEDRLLAEARALHHGIRALPGDIEGADTPGKLVADAMMESWAGHAYDPNDSASVAIHRAVAEEFGTGISPNITKDMTGNGDDPYNYKDRTKTPQQNLDELTKPHDMAILRAGLRSMHTATQRRMTELGVGDTVTVHRGVGRTVRGEQPIDINPASSWSTDRMIARRFAITESQRHYDSVTAAGQTGSIVTMTVPRERILSMPGYGLGCYEEAELVLTRGTTDVATWEYPG